MVLARQDDLEIRQHAAVGAAPLKRAKALAREPRLGDERRQARGDEDRDGPRREREQQAGVAAERDPVLRESERAVHERQRPDRRFLPRAIQLVVELRVLELRERQRQRLVEDQEVHALRQQHAQQRLAETDAALHTGERRDEQAFEATSQSTCA